MKKVNIWHSDVKEKRANQKRNVFLVMDVNICKKYIGVMGIMDGSVLVKKVRTFMSLPKKEGLYSPLFSKYSIRAFFTTHA